MNQTVSRDKIIIRTSIIGIIANLVLAGFKAVVGLASHSIAIVLDAVNNLSDALSSVITIVGAKLAGKAPDKKHPFGHGRIEYLSATIISVIILYAGITSLVESVKKILAPETPDYAPVTLLIVAAAVVVKLILGRYVKSTGEKVNSDSLVASGADATFDAVISASTLVAAGIYLISGIRLESWLGAIISVIIIKSGYEMLSDAVSQILGQRMESELTQSIKKLVCEEPEVRGAYDLILHSYGPELLIGSVHVEVPDTMTVSQLDELTRRIQHRVFHELHVALTAVGVYSYNTTDEEAAAIRRDILERVEAHPYVLQTHGFYLNKETKKITFDVILDFAAEDRNALHKEIVREIREAYPEYDIHVTMDTDVSD